jgi:hypothetical protein
VYGGTILPKAYKIQALELSSLMKKVNPGGDRRIDCEFEYLGKFEFIFKRAL